MTEHCLHLVLAEDEPAHAEAIRRAFQANSTRTELQVIGTLQEYRDLIRTAPPDLALLDLNLPDGRAMEVLTSPPEAGQFPVLIMTSFGDEQIAVEAMKAGALDYIVKSPETFATMPRLVDRALREWALLRARQQNEARIVHLNSVLHGIRNVNQLITKGKDRLPLLQQACDRLIETMGYKTAWIAIRTKDNGLQLAAHAGVTPLLATRLGEELDQGLVPHCAQQAIAQHHVFSQSLPREECRDCVMDAAYPDSGVLAVRMEHQNVMYGVMIASVPQAFVFDEEEQSLFHELVSDLSFALYRLDLEKQHRAAEEQLARSETRYRELLENIEDVVFSLDREGRVLYASPAVQRIYGYLPDELVGHHFQEIVHPEDVPGIQASFQRTLEGIVEPFEFRGLDTQGHVHHLRSTSRLRRENGEPVGINGVVIDITELRHALDAQLLSAERWQATFDAISDIVCVVSNEHQFIEINQAGCQSMGLTREQIIGRKCYEIVHGTSSPIHVCPCRMVGQSRGPATARHEEKGRTYELMAWPIARADGKSNGFVHIVKDITAEVSANKEKTQLAEQLKLSQRLEAVGRLAGGVAHDFNNLLAVILSYAGFAADELGPSNPIHADIVEIQNAGQRAAALTRQLLAFSRKQLLEPEVLNLNGVITGIESMLRRLLGEDIDIEVHLLEDLDCVMADPGQIEQVIMNLAVNARDAMPRGGRLTIETANIELDGEYADQRVAVKPGRYVLLSVTDSGSGMDEETRAHIFEPFFTTKAKGKGTGLGLSMVYGIVKQSSGNIWVYSEPDQGTTFKVYLPRVDSPAVSIKRRSASVMAIGSETVLIVEDEDAVRKLAERILRKVGYTILTAANGSDALALLDQESRTIDLLLTDVVMPQMSGRDLAERLTRSHPKLKVIYMSGYTDNAIVHHGVLDPGTCFIGKPFSAADLAHKVREALDEGKTVGS